MIDTASSLSLKRSFSIVKEKNRSPDGRHSDGRRIQIHPCVGRTHGSTANHHFRLKLLQLALPAPEGHGKAGTGEEQVSYAKFQGQWEPTPTANLLWNGECADLLGLKPSLVSTPILQRDRHSNAMNTLALLGGASTDLQQISASAENEVYEAMEPFAQNRKVRAPCPQEKPHPVRAQFPE